MFSIPAFYVPFLRRNKRGLALFLFLFTSLSKNYAHTLGAMKMFPRFLFNGAPSPSPPPPLAHRRAALCHSYSIFQPSLSSVTPFRCGVNGRSAMPKGNPAGVRLSLGGREGGAHRIDTLSVHTLWFDVDGIVTICCIPYPFIALLLLWTNTISFW